jgi:predicted SAM-dependent methyltransferase
MGDFGQEIKADLNQPWTFAEDGTVSQIACKDGFEHVASAEHFLAEAARILEPGGTLDIWVPHYKNPSAYRLTHVRLCAWSYFDAFPEPHDRTQSLKVVLNELYIGQETSKVWAPLHWLINRFPKWWERLFYASNVRVTFQKV